MADNSMTESPKSTNPTESESNLSNNAPTNDELVRFYQEQQVEAQQLEFQRQENQALLAQQLEQIQRQQQELLRQKQEWEETQQQLAFQQEQWMKYKLVERQKQEQQEPINQETQKI
jgi:hypothetical protein